MEPDETRVRAQIHRALGDLEASPWLRSGVVAALPDRTRPPVPLGLRTAGTLAAVLVIALIGSSVLIPRIAGRFAPAGSTPAGRAVGRTPVVTSLDLRCTLQFARVPGGDTVTVSLPWGDVAVYPRVANSFDVTYVGGRWIPAAAQWVAPDRGSYASFVWGRDARGQLTSTLHLIDVASGSDRTIWRAAGHANVLGWDHGLIAISVVQENPGMRAFGDNGNGATTVPRRGEPSPFGPPHIWLVDPARGTARQVWGGGPLPVSSPGSGRPQLVDVMPLPVIAAGAAWIVAIDQTATTPWPGEPWSDLGTGNLLERLDLATGAISTWYRAPAGQRLSTSGEDGQGHPMVALLRQTPPAGGRARTLIVTGRNRAVQVMDGADPEFAGASMAGDSHGLWIATASTIWLYRQGRLQRVATMPALPPQSDAPAASSSRVSSSRARMLPPNLAPYAPMDLTGPCR